MENVVLWRTSAVRRQRGRRRGRYIAVVGVLDALGLEVRDGAFDRGADGADAWVVVALLVGQLSADRFASGDEVAGAAVSEVGEDVCGASRQGGQTVFAQRA